jgi:hypothetical protein
MNTTIHNYTLVNPTRTDLRLATQIVDRWKDADGRTMVEVRMTEEHYECVAGSCGCPSTILPPHGAD